MKNLLYFEECVSPLSIELEKRRDINLVKIRPLKSLKRNFTEEQVNDKRFPTYIINNEENHNIDEFCHFNMEIEKFNAWLRENNITLDYFLNDSEFFLEYANKIARALNLESLTEEQVRWVRDKVDMKKKFNEIGLSTVAFAPINSRTDIEEFFKLNNSKPIIFKPRNGMNSIKVYKIESIDDIDNLSIEITPNKYMVEEFCQDQEWSIESLVQDGKVLDSYVTYIPNPTIWASISNSLNCHMTVPKTPEYFKFVPKDFIQKIVDGMELKNGVMTIEVFIDKNGNVKPSELGWRLPGCQATTNHGISYGIDIYNLLIDIAIHNKVELKYRDRIVSVGDLYLPNKEGIVTQITNIDELLNMDGVIDGKMFIKVGDYSKKRRLGNDASGWVQIIGNDEKDTLIKMQRVFNNFKIEVIKKEMGKQYVKKK